MILTYPEINYVFNTDSGKVNVLVVENPKFLLKLLTDISRQVQGEEGSFVISDKGKILDTGKYTEVLMQYVPFELNKKTLLSKIISAMERNAVSDSYYMRTMEIMSELENHLLDISFDLNGDIGFSKLDIGQIIKAIGVNVKTEYDSLGEKLIDYFELVTSYDRNKLFILVNLHSYLSDNEMSQFMKTVLSHGFHVLLIESHEYKMCQEEIRVIIDNDLCEIV